MECPECNSTYIRKNGIKRGKQNHICVNCRRQFVDSPQTTRGYSETVKRECLKMSLNGMASINKLINPAIEEPTG
jgi:transposase-like protein